jgi:quinol monooxygenase YgiN
MPGRNGANLRQFSGPGQWTPPEGHAISKEFHMVHLLITLRATKSTAPHLVAALRTLMGAVRLEPGFDASSVWTTEREDDGGLVVHYEEQWADEKAMEARVRSDRFTKLLEVVERAPDDPKVEFQFVAKRHGLEYVETVRGTAR